MNKNISYGDENNNINYENEWQQESLAEFITFYDLCGKKDKVFFDAPREKRKEEDYARLMCIALAFGFHKMALRILANIGNENDFDAFINAISNDARTVIKWFEDFVAAIPTPEVKAVIAEIWKKKREQIDETHFMIRTIFE